MPRKYRTLFDLVAAAIGDKASHASNFIDLFADDAVLEYPFAPDGTPKRLTGKASISAHAARLGPMLEFGEFTLQSTFSSGDTVIFEASCTGRGIETGLAYDQQYICVIQMRDGRISRYRDYWNPLVLISALGGQDAMAKAYAA